MENDDSIISGKLQKAVWQFVDQFRGKVSTRDHLTYFLPLFFFKYICDRSGELPDHLKKSLKPERFLIPKDARFDSIVKNCDENNVAEKLNKALSDIEYANGDKLSGIFVNFKREISWHTDAETKRFGYKTLRFLAGIDLRPTSVSGDIIAQFFSWILHTWAKEQGKVGASFYTPLGITRLIARLIQAKSKESIYDPALGAASLLIEMTKGGQQKSDGANLYGQEINEQVSCLARMNLIINELDRAQIDTSDSINNPRIDIDQETNASLARFDIVVSNPPFSPHNWWRGGKDYGRFKWGMPPSARGDYAFILHILASTNKNGRAAVIASHGVLFRGGSESEIREHIIKANLLDAVIGLPANIFLDTGIPAALLVFDKRRKRNDNILFIDASQEFEQDKRINVLDEEHIGKIASIFSAFKKGTLKTGSDTMAVPHRPVSIAEIEENNFNINIPRYVQLPEKKETVDVNQLQREVDELELKLAAINKKIRRALDGMGNHPR